MRVTRRAFFGVLLLPAACRAAGRGGSGMGLAGNASGSLAGQVGRSLAGNGAGGGVSPPVPDAGPDASFDLLSASPCQLAGSATGTGPITYLWTKVGGSGTPVPTFADATNPLTTCIFDVDGAVTLDLATTNAGGTTHDQVTITVTATLSALLTRMATGGRVCEWWQTGLGQTDNAGLLETIVSQGNNPTWDPTQGTVGQRPTSSATGGPLANGPCITFPRLADRVTDTTISIAAGKALFFGAVVKGTATAARVQTAFRDGATEGAGDVVFSCAESVGGLFSTTAKCTGGSEETANHTSPAHHANWYFKTLRYAAGLAPEAKINNASVSPGFATSTGLCAAVEVMTIGHTGIALGSWYLEFVFEAVATAAGAACLSEEAAIRYCVFKATGL